MAATPEPTTAEVRAALPAVAPRVSAALNEVKRRLETNLASHIQYHNECEDYAAGKGVLTPDNYYLKPAVLDDKYLNSLVIGHSIQRSTYGSGVFKCTLMLDIYDIQGRAEARSQVEDNLDRLGVVAAYLIQFLGGCVDANDRHVWDMLTPGSEQDLPNDSESWKKYYGRWQQWQMILGPGNGGWSMEPPPVEP